MIVKYNKNFLKELNKLPNNISANIENFVFETLPKNDNLQSVGKIEKLSGHKNCFKVRFGNYRVGIKKQDDEIIIATVKHRKEIYKFFP
jgi:mRNA interferase RelE/StbE